MENRQAERRKYHFIYKTTCSVNGKFYYGMHSTDNLEDGYIGSGTYLWHSIKKHGREAFSLEILEHLFSREALKLREKELINEEMLKDPMCMNLKSGGEGGWDQTNQKLTQEHRVAAGKKAGFKKALAAQTKDRQQQRAIHAGKFVKNHRSMEGKSHSAKTKQKMSETHRQRPLMMWMSKDGKQTMIKVNQLDEFLAQGFVKGRMPQ